MSLDINLTISRFQTLAGTERAHLEGGRVVGAFAESRRLVVANVVRFCETFANCHESESRIVRFTRRYSPLHVVASPGEPFSFALTEWREWHKKFQWKWKQSTTSELPNPSELGISSWKNVGRMVFLEGGNFLGFSSKGTVFHAQQLSTLIDVCFAAIPLERLRVCPGPECTTPYFVAHHLKQTFCGNKKCIDWGKRKLKLEYWKRNKKRLLAERKRKRQGASNVT